MKIDLLDNDRLISVNKLEEVTSANIFVNRNTFDPEGLLSNDIFGISKNDRRNTFAYINLKRKFIHPHLYEKVLKRIYRNIEYLVAGIKRFSIQDKQLVEDKEGWTGLAKLYDHWDEIDWSKSKSANSINKNILTRLSRDQVFIDTLIVCPPAYRDIMLAGTVDSSDHEDKLNDLYRVVIRGVSQLSQGGLFAATQYATQNNIQDKLVEIYDYFKDKISRKQGLIRKSLIGKSVDYGVRSVISAPTYDNEHFEDNMVDIEHASVPISQCCSLFYPFIESWLRNFFTREIINDPKIVTFFDPITKKEISGVIKDADVQFSEKNIRKMINDYCLNPDNRFKILEVKINDPISKNRDTINVRMLLKGKAIFENNTSKEINRPLTITDILYVACVDVCEKRHVMVSRYPVGTDKGIYFNRIRVQSTRKHCRLVFNGKEYPNYPVIDFKTQEEKVGVQFIDTLVFSNSHLEGMGKQMSLLI